MKNVALACCWVSLAAAAADADEKPFNKPSIIVILADDLGYGDLGCYGSTRITTPHIDRLAREGLRFTDFHSNGASCSPTRASLLSGRYPKNVGIEQALSEKSGLKAEVRTIAEYLKPAGYTTAVFGKWHLGSRPDSPALPNRQGFDEFYGARHGGVDYVSHVDRYGRLDWWHNDEPLVEEGYATDLLTDHAVHFIERHRAEPFFVYLSHVAIHFPWMAPDRPAYRQVGGDYDNDSKLGPHAPEEIKDVVDRMIENLDESVGRVLEAVRRLPADRETLIVFTSDNGGYLRYAQFQNISSNGPLRGQKIGMYEGGHRVPCIAWWPGRIAEKTETDATTMTMDLLPTFVEFAGAPPPSSGDTQPFDGVSLVPLLMRGELPSSRTLFWRAGEMKAVRQGPWKIVIEHGSTPRLYRLDEDLAESRDLAATEPKRVAEMIAALTAWENSNTSQTP